MTDLFCASLHWKPNWKPEVSLPKLHYSARVKCSLEISTNDKMEVKIKNATLIKKNNGYSAHIVDYIIFGLIFLSNQKCILFLKARQRTPFQFNVIKTTICIFKYLV